mmetsp:Transcript_6659/g.9771  ORF Transcript_6659/g.9771 Transcript_6659/m.9771 type:complete len:945 (-) Transcript_6659:28-2862(-)
MPEVKRRSPSFFRKKITHKFQVNNEYESHESSSQSNDSEGADCSDSSRTSTNDVNQEQNFQRMTSFRGFKVRSFSSSDCGTQCASSMSFCKEDGKRQFILGGKLPRFRTKLESNCNVESSSARKSQYRSQVKGTSEINENCFSFDEKCEAVNEASFSEKVEKIFDDEFFSEHDKSSPNVDWWSSPTSTKSNLQKGFDEEFFSFRPSEEKAKCVDDMEPPEIRRVTLINDLELFPISPTQGMIANDVLLHYDMGSHYDMRIRGQDVSPAREDKKLINDNEVDFKDDETVIISNKKIELLAPNLEGMTRKGILGLARGGQENLKTVFNVTLSTPIELPIREKRKFSLKRFISNTGRSNRGVSAPFNTSVSDIAVAPSASCDLEVENRSVWKRIPRSNENDILRDAQDKILSGRLFDYDKNVYPVRKTHNSPEKRNKSRKTPAKKLEILMNKKVHRRTASEQMTKIRSIMSRDSEVVHVAKEKTQTWNLVDDAIRGRFDGIDVISYGACSRKFFLKRNIEQKSSFERYTPRTMIVETLWSNSGRDSEIVFEGYTQRGCGSDRWSAPVASSKSKGLVPTNLWGQNKTPPNITSELIEVDDGEGKTRLVSSPYRHDSKRNILMVQTLDNLKLAHEFAAAPLKDGDIEKSIKIFQKILANLKVKYKSCGSKNHVVGSTYHNIALLLMWNGQFEEALTYMNKAVAVRVMTLGHNHASVAVSLARQAMIYITLERFGSAFRATSQALGIRQTLNDQDHMEVSKLYINIGMIRFLQGDKKLALKDLTTALQIQRKWLDGSLCRESVLFDTSVTLSNMGKIYLEREKYDMAAYLFSEALHLQTNVFSRDHNAVLANLGNVAFAKALAGEITNAIRIYKSRYNIQAQKFGEESRQAVETKGFMSLLYMQQSNHVNAIRCLEHVLRWQMHNLHARHPALQNTKSTIDRLNILNKFN